MREGWRIVKLDEIISFERGLTYAKGDEVTHSSVGVLRSNNVDLTTQSLNLDEIKYLRDDFEVPEKKKVRKSSLLMCMSNGSKDHLGKVALIDEDLDYAFGGFMGLITPDDTKVVPKYLYYALASKSFKDYIHSLADGANINNLKYKDLAAYDILLLPLPEQQRIVDILDREFAKIDALKANAEKSLQVAKDLFRHISNGYYNEPSPVSKLGDECIFVRGPFGGSLKKSCFVPFGYPVYEQQHAIYSTFTFRYFVNEEKYNEMKRFTTHPGDLIMSCSGTIGKVAIIPEDAPIGIINQALLKLTPKKRILPEYLKWYMQSISFEKDIQRHSKGAAIQNVASVAILKEIAIPVPTIEKQKQIVARLDDLNERCNALQENYQKTLTLCDDLKQSLLRKAFNGEM